MGTSVPPAMGKGVMIATGRGVMLIACLLVRRSKGRLVWAKLLSKSFLERRKSSVNVAVVTKIVTTAMGTSVLAAMGKGVIRAKVWERMLIACLLVRCSKGRFARPSRPTDPAGDYPDYSKKDGILLNGYIGDKLI